MKVELPEKVYDEIKEYCRVNNIDDVDKFIRKILNQGFTTEKWGVIGENKEPKVEIVEKIIEKVILSAITTEPEIKIVEKIVVSAVTTEPEIKIIYTGVSTESEIKVVEKIVVSATTNEITKYISTGNTINHVYNVYVKPELEKKKINNSIDNTDLYGERNIRKT